MMKGIIGLFVALALICTPAYADPVMDVFYDYVNPIWTAYYCAHPGPGTYYMGAAKVVDGTTRLSWITAINARQYYYTEVTEPGTLVWTIVSPASNIKLMATNVVNFCGDKGTTMPGDLEAVANANCISPERFHSELERTYVCTTNVTEPGRYYAKAVLNSWSNTGYFTISVKHIKD